MVKSESAFHAFLSVHISAAYGSHPNPPIRFAADSEKL